VTRDHQDKSVASSSPIAQRRKELAIAVVLVATTAAACSTVAGNGFIRYDDPAYITANRPVLQGLSWSGVEWAMGQFHSGNWHPLTWMSHMLDVELFGKWAGGHHLVSLALHVCNVLLLFGLLSRTAKRLWAAAFVAGLFALHPLHVESVAWASERKDVLSTFFWLATMWMYVLYVHKPAAWRYVRMLALFAMGLMAKPMLVTLPIVLMLVDYWPLQRRLSRRVVLEKLPLLIMVAASILVTLKAQTGALADLQTLDVPSRMMNAVASYGTYVVQMLWPVDLAVFYPFERGGLGGRALFAALLMLGSTAAAICWGRRHRYTLVGWLWYVVTLVPVIGLVQVGSQSHADRYTYVPLIGLFVIIAFWVDDMASRHARLPRIVVPGGMVVLVVLGVITFRQCGYWKDDLTLFGHAVHVTHDNAVALSNYGAALGEEGKFDEAYATLQQALLLAKYDDLNLLAMGELLTNHGRYDDAITCYSKALDINSSLKDAWLGRAKALASLGRVQEAQECCRKAIGLDAEWPEAWHMLGMVYGQSGRLDEALDAFGKAGRFWPPMPSAWLNMARIHGQRGQYDMAIAECRQSIALEPYYETYQYLGMLLAETNRLAEAEQAFREAVRLSPSSAEPHYYLGMALASVGRKAEASVEMEKALALDPNNAAIREACRGLSESGR
jgi:protein O-mannosyl-transferase